MGLLGKFTFALAPQGDAGKPRGNDNSGAAWLEDIFVADDYICPGLCSECQSNGSASASAFRSKYWDNVVERSIQSSMTSSNELAACDTDSGHIVFAFAVDKSAVCSGILIAPANFTWPIIPTLAICGRCDDAQVKVECSSGQNPAPSASPTALM
ncbi:hypothetical protein CP533_0668 [Ophiocordyceps camponoti-saundersi (nom. inval.)]|nr:hypothetical protein CP533_0668 [Ophiocordyceps camponoti-saundersi (nom. inval.)]